MSTAHGRDDPSQFEVLVATYLKLGLGYQELVAGENNNSFRNIMTDNKWVSDKNFSQTLLKIGPMLIVFGINLGNHCFLSGQLYLACYRVKILKKIFMLVSENLASLLL